MTSTKFKKRVFDALEAHDLAVHWAGVESEAKADLVGMMVDSSDKTVTFDDDDRTVTVTLVAPMTTVIDDEKLRKRLRLRRLESAVYTKKVVTTYVRDDEALAGLIESGKFPAKLVPSETMRKSKPYVLITPKSK